MRRLPVIVLSLGLLGLAGCSATTAGTPAPTGAPVAAAPTSAAVPEADFCTNVESTVEPGNRLASWYAGEPVDDAQLDPTIAELRESNTAISATAPPEIASDVETVSGLMTALLNSLERTRDPQASLLDPGLLFAAAGAGDSPDRLRDYVQANCGFSLDYLPTN